jgi:trehalose 6-phosphate phosphatase
VTDDVVDGQPAAAPTAPGDVAALVRARPRPWLVGVDVDGTLAPIAPRPEAARLLAGARRSLTALDDLEGVTVAVVSGRSLTDLEVQFRLPTRLVLVGSHGAETPSSAGRTDDESQRLAAVHAVMDQAARALPGAWVESKAFGAAFHVRQADPEAAATAMARLGELFARHDELMVQPGHAVLEVSVRLTSKADAVGRLRVATGAATVVFIGDDATDERVFASLGPDDVGVKVGEGPTTASVRVRGPDDVVALLTLLADGG